jgi:hypothetical protein
MTGIGSASDSELSGSVGEGRPAHSTSDTLFWSKRGDIACPVHAPDPASDRWRLEAWRSIPDQANGRHGLAYQCPRCAPDGRRHRHIHAAERKANDFARSA